MLDGDSRATGPSVADPFLFFLVRPNNVNQAPLMNMNKTPEPLPHHLEHAQNEQDWQTVWAQLDKVSNQLCFWRFMSVGLAIINVVILWLVK